MRIVIIIALFTLTTFASDQIIKGKLYTPATTQQFNEILQKHEFVVVDFYAEWCQPCRQLHKVLDALAADKDLDEILFVKIDTQQHSALASTYNITSIPVIILFVDGTLLTTVYGYKDKKTLKQILQQSFFE